MAASPSFQRVEFATGDPAEAREYIDRVYGGRLTINGTRDSSWLVGVTGVETGSFSTTTEMRLPAELTFKIDGQDQFLICTLLAGEAGIDDGKITDRYRRGDVFVSNHPDADWAGYTRNGRLHVLALPQTVLTDVARADPDAADAPWRMLSFRPVPGGVRRWHAVTRFVDDLFADPSAAVTPLVIGSAARLLAATAITVFPNTALTEPTIGDRRDGHPQTLHRAIAFIEANAGRDITLTDIAAAACVTVRAVQLAFRRHLNTTPTEYLRRVRLDHAHRELRAASPERDTVTAVAYRWGFSSASRFATYYRRAYGVPPSHTLRT